MSYQPAGFLGENNSTIVNSYHASLSFGTDKWKDKHTHQFQHPSVCRKLEIQYEYPTIYNSLEDFKKRRKELEIEN